MDDLDAQNTHGNAKRVIGRPFENGNPGKSLGTQNKLTKTVKEKVLEVFNEIQTDPKVKLSQFAKDHPRDFYQIAAKLIPTDIQADIRTLVQVEQIVGMKIKDVVTS